MSSSDSEDDQPVRRVVRRAMERRRPRAPRYFCFVDVRTGQTYGRYTGQSPKQAASKCFTKYVQGERSRRGANPILRNFRLYIREVTRGSQHKIYAYDCTRIQLRQAQEVVIRDRNSGQERRIIHRHQNRVNRVRIPDDLRRRLEPAHRERKGLPAQLIPKRPVANASILEDMPELTDLTINSNVTFALTDSNVIEI